MKPLNAVSKPLSAEVWRIPAESRGFLPVSQTRGPDGQAVALSTYGDMKWDFSPYVGTVNIPHHDICIDFSGSLPSGASLSDVRHRLLLNSVKEFIYVRWMFPAVKSGKYLKARTLIGEWRQMGLLLDWLIANELTRLEDISPEVAREFVEWIIERREREKRSKRYGLKTVALIETMYHCRTFMSDAPRKHPWPDSGIAIELGYGIAERNRGAAATEIIPRRLLTKLGSFTQAFLTDHGPRLVSVWRAVWSEADCIIDAMQREDDCNGRFRWGRSKLVTSAQKEAALHKRLSDHLPYITRKHGYESLEAFLTEIDMLRTACYVLCGMFSGMRDSELSALRHGCFKKTIEPDGEEYFWLEGVIFKTEEDARPGRWMVPPVVEQAVQCAEALSEPLSRRARVLQNWLEVDYAALKSESARAKLARQIERYRKLEHCLFVRSTNWRLLPVEPKNSTTNKRLKDIAAMAELTVDIDDMGEVRDRTKIPPGSQWPLATHQFRRTFAVFVARNLLGDVRYLRHHYKHWSIDMSLHYAQDPTLDDTIFDSVTSMRDELQANLIAGWIAGKQKVSGGRAPQVIQFRSRGTVKTAKDVRDLARSLGDGIYVRGTGHSWCLAESDGCGGEGLYDAIRCVGCGESLIDESHIQVWQAIRDQQIELMDSPDLGVPGKTRVQKHLDAANAVLHELGAAGGNEE